VPPQSKIGDKMVLIEDEKKAPFKWIEKSGPQYAEAPNLVNC
jgi:hypothetical protein